jgi:hypothetical protein
MGFVPISASVFASLGAITIWDVAATELAKQLFYAPVDTLASRR